MTAEAHAHAMHPEIVERLRRAGRPLRSVIEMIESGRGCLDIAQQLRAVEKVIVQARKALIHDHNDHCLDGIVRPPGKDERSRIGEFRLIATYL